MKNAPNFWDYTLQSAQKATREYFAPLASRTASMMKAMRTYRVKEGDKIIEKDIMSLHDAALLWNLDRKRRHVWGRGPIFEGVLPPEQEVAEEHLIKILADLNADAAL